MVENQTGQTIILDSGVSLRHETIVLMSTNQNPNPHNSRRYLDYEKKRATYFSKIFYGEQNLLVFSCRNNGTPIPISTSQLFMDSFAKIFNQFEDSIVSEYLNGNTLRIDTLNSAEPLEYFKNLKENQFLTAVALSVQGFTQSASSNPRSYLSNWDSDKLPIVEKHVEHFSKREVSTVKELEMILNPRDFRFGESEYDFLKSVGSYFRNSSDVKSPAYRDFIRQVFSFLDIDSFEGKGWVTVGNDGIIR